MAIFGLLSNRSPISYAPGSDMSGNIDAFLAVILEGESSHNYKAIVGGGSFSDYSKHPGLNANGSINKAFMPGAPSHACGGYQFQPGTWKRCADALHLPDFSPDSQDRAAVYLLQSHGAYDAIVNGDVAIAADLLKSEWEMFQTSRWNSAAVEKAFTEYGGTLA